MTTTRDRLFKATYPTSPKKERNVFQPKLEILDETATLTRIDSKEDAANAVKVLLNHDGCYSPKRR